MPLRLADNRGSTGGASGLLRFSHEAIDLLLDGSTAAGQTAAQSGAQVVSQQPKSSWLTPIDCDAAIGQSCDGAAKAGLDETTRESMSPSKAIRRRIRADYSKGVALSN